MLAGLLYAAAFPIELCALFAIWNWSRCGRSALWLASGGVLIIVMAILLMLVDQPIPARIYLGFAGMYVFSRLAWAWIVDGLAPENWKFGEITLALLVTGMFAVANSGW